jgi:hypothetical protein
MEAENPSETSEITAECGNMKDIAILLTIAMKPESFECSLCSKEILFPATGRMKRQQVALDTPAAVMARQAYS